jgi:hypothetical protein
MKLLSSHSRHITQSTWAQRRQKWVLSSTAVVDSHWQHSFVDRCFFSFVHGTDAFEVIMIGGIEVEFDLPSGTGVYSLFKCCG